MHNDLRGLAQIPLQVTSKARTVIEHAEQDRRYPFAAGGENLARANVTIMVDEPSYVLGLVAPDLTVDEPGLGALRAFRAARRDAAPFGKAIGLQEPAQCRVGWYGLEIGPALGQRDEIVVVQLRA
jgi:hypothetical protein